jgi:hypothetical protein
VTHIPDTTADAVVAAVEGVVLSRGIATEQSIAEFLDLPAAKAREAIQLAEDLQLIRTNGQSIEVASPLARLLTTPVLQQRAAILRIAVEAYEPFRVFREILHMNGGLTSTAAQQTKAVLGSSEHRDVIRATLTSLGTYSSSLKAAAAGEFAVHFDYDEDLRSKLRESVSQLGEADLRIRDWISEDLRSYASTEDVLNPLAEAYLKASQGDARGTIVNAGNAAESFLAKLASDMAVDVSSAHGLGAKVAKLSDGGKIPKKIAAIGRYLGNVRNAADHGVDPEIGAAWLIRDGSGEDYLRVAITFIESCLSYHQGKPPAL